MLLIASAEAAEALAVIEFAVHAEDPALAPLGRGVADMLLTDLSALSAVQVVERSRIDAVLAELALAESGLLDPATAARAGKGLGATWLVTGAITSVAPEMRVDARVIDVASGAVLAASSVHGPTDEFFLLEKELANEIVRAIAVVPSARESARLGRVATESFDAFTAWSRGLEALDRGAVDEARSELDRALAADPAFGLARERLDALASRLAAVESERRASYSAEAAALLDGLSRVTAGGDVSAVVKDLPMRSHGLSAEERRSICRRLLDLSLPETALLAPGFSVNEWAVFDYANASAQLGHRADVLTWGEVFLTRYPRSNLYPSMKLVLEQVVAQVRAEEAGRERRAAIEAAAAARELEVRCSPAVPLPERLAACRGQVELMDAHALPRSDWAHQSWLRAARALGDDAELARVEADASAHLPGSELLEEIARAREDLARRRETLGDARARRQKAEDPGSFDQLARWLADVGRFAEAHDVLGEARARFPEDPRPWSTSIALLLDEGRGPEAAALAREGGARVEPATTRRIDEALAARARADEAEGDGLHRLALGLADAKLYADAATTWEALGRRFPGLTAAPAPRALSDAADCWARAMVPGAVDRARALWEEVAARWPDTPQGSYAASALKTLPR